MDYKEGNSPDKSADESVDEMLKHLKGAKERYQTDTRETRRSKSETPLQRTIRQRSDSAVLASNHEARLEEIATNDAVTHRSGKRWASAKVGVDVHGRLPIYYRLDGLVTHKGYITDIILDPDENTAAADEFVQNITDNDTYSEYYDKLNTTTFIVTDGEQLDEPFPQSELKKLSGDGNIDENFSRQPAYVVQHPGDFPSST